MISWGTGDVIAKDVISHVVGHSPGFGNDLRSIALCALRMRQAKPVGGSEKSNQARDFSAASLDRSGGNLQIPATALPVFEMTIPPPHQIFVQYERGEIEREEMQALMALHARELISEMEEDYQNPAAAWIEQLLSRRAGSKWVKRHSNRLLREVLSALADVPDFPLARYFWNAMHPDVPIHCFFRIRREPVFQIRALDLKGETVRATIEYGVVKGEKPVKREFVFRRDDQWQLKVVAQ